MLVPHLLKIYISVWVEFEDLHLKMQTHKRLTIPFSNQRKSLRSKPDFKTGDKVFYFSPRGKWNLSQKLTLRYRIVNTIHHQKRYRIVILWEPGLYIRDVYSLNSRLKKVDPKFSPTVQEQVDLNLLPYGESENVAQEDEAHSPEKEPEDRTDHTVEISLDDITLHISGAARESHET